MSLFVEDQDFQLWHGDALEVLKGLPAESVHCALTSPPFYGLRDYGTGSWEGGDEGCDHVKTVLHAGRDSDRPKGWDGNFRNTSEPRPIGYGDLCGKCGARRVDQQIGLEATPEQWVARLVEVFREVKRVLRKDGTLWVECGTSYASNVSGGMTGSTLSKRGQQTTHSRQARAGRGSAPSQPPSPPSAPACGTDDTALQGSPAPDSACLDLCDGCLADFLSHHGRTVHNLRSTRTLDAQLPERTDRDSELGDSAQASADGAPPGVPVSTMLRSWRQLRGECSDCSSRASALAVVRSSALDARASEHTEPRTNGNDPPASESHSQGTDASGTAWVKYKPKDLIMQPFLLAEALRQDGWYLRQIIVWAKPNCMPESATDRCTTSHSYVLLLSKSRSYFFDATAIAEPGVEPDRQRFDRIGGSNGHIVRHSEGAMVGASASKNARSVWDIPTQGYSGAHFATFPEALVERIILAGTSERGCCPECGAPWERETESTKYEPPIVEVGVRNVDDSRGDKTRKLSGSDYNKQVRKQTTGWRPTCLEERPECRALGHDPCPLPAVPCTVLDPFGGSGTTALVARRLARKSVLIELNESYCEMAARRLQQLSLLA